MRIWVIGFGGLGHKICRFTVWGSQDLGVWGLGLTVVVLGFEAGSLGVKV